MLCTLAVVVTVVMYALTGCKDHPAAPGGSADSTGQETAPVRFSRTPGPLFEDWSEKLGADKMDSNLRLAFVDINGDDAGAVQEVSRGLRYLPQHRAQAVRQRLF
jgi:hypothetical protein